ncbi:MAG: NAD(P)H-dependent glycerol-3-phosphate dehydrogenase [Chloroflexota bacterium]
MRGKVAVLGAGGWGTALAVLLARKGLPVYLWARRAELVAQLREQRQNPDYLPGVELPRMLAVTADIGEAVGGARAVVFSTPSHGLRDVARQLGGQVAPDTLVVGTSKGFEAETLRRGSEVLAEELPGASIAVISGPNFAQEVARGQTATTVAAATSESVAARAQDLFMTADFRVYTNTDLIGVETGGALKNIYAIAAGICDGLGLGNNARAAVITRGLFELSRLGQALGGRRETFFGLSGLGDLVLTCTGELSRNHRAGVELGRGRTLTEIQASTRQVFEGVRTTKAALDLAARTGVDLPMAQEVYNVLYGGKRPEHAVVDLMARDRRDEGMRWT